MTTDNLQIWRSLEKTDPKHVKPITGKSYQGNSPKPHYIIYRLTEQFGPLGYGFGWKVLREAYIDGKPHQDGTEKLHECRIEFWTRDPDTGDKAEPVESYGCTKALYKAKQGYWVDDEDAAKKSLTDAIVKAASWLGVAGDIFMGRWDDNKYVAELREEFSPANRAKREATGRTNPNLPPAPPPVDMPPIPHDPETGEVINAAQAASSGLHDAWEDGIRDALPEGATERQFFEACFEQIKTEFRGYGSLRGLEGGWSKRQRIIDRMQHEAPDLFEDMLEVYTRAKTEIEAQQAANTEAKAKGEPILTKAAGEAIVAGIKACKDWRALDTFMQALERGPNAHAARHPKIRMAEAERRAEFTKADPVVIGDVRIA